MKKAAISIYRFIQYKFRSLHNLQYQIMDKTSIQETLRKSREVEERYKKFLQDKIESDKQWTQTQAKIDKTLIKLSETKQTIKQIDQLYENYQKSFDKAINAALQSISANKLLQVPDPDFVPREGTPKQVANLLKNKKKVVIMTGAGVSAASGIPTFRDKDGYWTKKKLQGISPEQFLTLYNFEANRLAIWEWLQDFYCTKIKCKPNAGHASIDSICNKILSKKAEVCIITQNIDNYHIQSQAREKNQKKQQQKYPIYEVHGNILKVRCDKCASGKPEMLCYPYVDFRQAIKSKKLPTCPKCKQNIRPHIMFFDEFYTQKFHHSESVKKFVAQADLLIVAGTALQTGLARLTVEDCLQRKIDIVEINTQCTIRQKNVIWMQGKSDQILMKINQNL